MTPAVVPARSNPPSEIITATGLIYASLLISLLTTFIAMLGKQWLNRYLRSSGGLITERCGERQRKCDGLEEWWLHLFVESLPVMLQVSLFLFACGLCQHMCSINASVAYVLINITGLGVLLYVAIVIAGMSSYTCPFQTPVAVVLRGQWKKVRPVLSATHQMLKAQVQQSKPWFKPKDLAVLRGTNTNDVQCVSWILRNITDPEALDAAIRLAGTIRWFDDGVNVEPLYDAIVSVFEGCFDSAGKLYPDSRDRAYHSAQATAWIRVLAMCKSKEFEHKFHFPDKDHVLPDLDHDLRNLLTINYTALRPAFMLMVKPEQHTPSYLQWISNILLHHSWANRAKPDCIGIVGWPPKSDGAIAIPLNTTLNRLLMWCNYFGSPVDEEVLRLKDKSCDVSYFCSSSYSPQFNVHQRPISRDANPKPDI